MYTLYHEQQQHPLLMTPSPCSPCRLNLDCDLQFMHLPIRPNSCPTLGVTATTKTYDTPESTKYANAAWQIYTRDGPYQPFYTRVYPSLEYEDSSESQGYHQSGESCVAKSVGTVWQCDGKGKVSTLRGCATGSSSCSQCCERVPLL
jgi:hypothetical protein